jgi:hypothetical protein
MPKNNGKHWSSSDQSQLRKLARENTPTRVIALKLGRTSSAVYGKAGDLSVNLKPVNQSPYGTKKK